MKDRTLHEKDRTLRENERTLREKDEVIQGKNVEIQSLQVFSSVGITVILQRSCSDSDHALCNVGGQRESYSAERGSDSRQRGTDPDTAGTYVSEQIAAGCWVDLEGCTGPLFERCNGI